MRRIKNRKSFYRCRYGGVPSVFIILDAIIFFREKSFVNFIIGLKFVIYFLFDLYLPGFSLRFAPRRHL